MNVLLLSLALAAGAEPAGGPRLAGRPLADWVRDLDDKDPLVREEAVAVLGDAGSAAKEALPRLEKMLQEDPPSLRLRAALAVWHVGGRSAPAAVALAERIRDEPSLVLRQQAIQTLQSMGAAAAPAVPTLLDLGDDPDPNVRIQVLNVIPVIGKPALPAVLERLNHKDARQRRRAVAALARISNHAHDAIPTLRKQLADEDLVVRGQCARVLWWNGQTDKPVVDALADAVRGGDAELRLEVLNSVNIFQDPARLKAARPVFELALKGPDRAARMTAAQALFAADGKAEEVLPIFLEGLKERNRLVWAPAALGVSKIGPKAAEAVPALLELYQSPEGLGSFEIQEALVRIGPASIPPLVEVLTSAKTQPNVANLVGVTLGRLGAPAARAVVPLLDHTDPRVRRTACQAVGHMGADAKAAVPKLAGRVKDADQTVRQAALAALSQLGPVARPAAPEVLELVKDAQPHIRYQSLMTLERIGADPAAVKPVIKEAMKDPMPYIRAQALTLLWVVDPGNEEVLPGAMALLKEANTRFYGINLLIRMGPAAAKAVPDLAALLKNNDVNINRQLVQALGQIGPAARSTVPDLIPLLKPRDQYMRQLVVTALRNIGGGDPKELVPAVLEVLKDDQGTFVRGQVYDLLAEHGPAAAEAVPALLDELRRPVWQFQPQATAALARISPERGRKEGVPLLKKWLTNQGVRLPAAGSLLRLDPENKEAFGMLATILKDPAQGWLRQQAADAVAVAGPAAKEAAPALRELLRDPQPAIRLSGAAALWRVAGDADTALPVVREALKPGSQVYLRHQAVLKLTDMGPAAKAAVPALLEIRNDPDQYLRQIVATALIKIDPDAAKPAKP
jgi:HEAT repeat protein